MDLVKHENEEISDEDAFDDARAWVIALLQKIVVYEYLPAILSSNYLPEYSGFKETVDPQINAFFAIAFRYGHSEIPVGIKQGSSLLPLAKNLFNTAATRQVGELPFLKGMSEQASKVPDTTYIDDLRRSLFSGAPIDLLAIDIAR